MSNGAGQFDPTRFAVSGASDPGEVGVKKVITKIDVRKPNKQEFFQTHPLLRLKACVVELAITMSREIYLLDPSVTAHIPGDFRVRNLTLCQNRHEGLFLWPVPDSASETMTTKWNTTAEQASALACDSWIRMVANMHAGEYEIYSAENLAIEPTWPDLEMPRVIELAFGKDRIIDTESHPVVRQLQGLE